MKEAVLIEACKYGRADVVQVMLDRGTNMNASLQGQSGMPGKQAIGLQFAALMGMQLFGFVFKQS